MNIGQGRSCSLSVNKAGVINGVVHRAYPVLSRRRGLLEIYLEADISRPHDWLKMEGKKEKERGGGDA